MNVRDYLNQNSAIVTVVAVAMLALALGFLVYRNRSHSSQAPTTLYFYDLGSAAADPIDRLFPGKASDLPPVPAPSGETQKDGSPAGVRAWVFACGECSDRSAMFVGYLETYTPQYKEVFEKSGGHPRPPAAGRDGLPLPEGRLVASPDKLKWVEFLSGEGTIIVNKAHMHCPAEIEQRACFPTDSK